MLDKNKIEYLVSALSCVLPNAIYDDKVFEAFKGMGIRYNKASRMLSVEGGLSIKAHVYTEQEFREAMKKNPDYPSELHAHLPNWKGIIGAELAEDIVKVIGMGEPSSGLAGHTDRYMACIKKLKEFVDHEKKAAVRPS